MPIETPQEHGAPIPSHPLRKTPKADLHRHAETSAHLDRLLAERNDLPPYDWEISMKSLAELPPGMPRIERLKRRSRHRRVERPRCGLPARSIRFLPEATRARTGGNRLHPEPLLLSGRHEHPSTHYYSGYNPLTNIEQVKLCEVPTPPHPPPPNSHFAPFVSFVETKSPLDTRTNVPYL